MSPVAHALLMAALGFFAATIGSLAGLGGGFLVAPSLRLFFALPPDRAAATSLVLVFANVASASLAFLRQGRVDVRLALTMGAFAVPGSIAGALLVRHAKSVWFDSAYAALLVVVAIDLVRRGKRHAGGGVAALPWSRPRAFRDRLSGEVFRYAESAPVAALAGATLGLVSSFFGIGGGIIAVPLFLNVFGLPAHIATATSHMVILLSSPVGVTTNVIEGDVRWIDALPLAVGGIAGGQAGAALSRRMSGTGLVRILAVVLLAAATGLVANHVLDLAHR